MPTTKVSERYVDMQCVRDEWVLAVKQSNDKVTVELYMMRTKYKYLSCVKDICKVLQMV